MGCAASQPGDAALYDAPFRALVPAALDAVLTPFDEPLANELASGCVRLLAASCLRTDGLQTLERRQDLEAREQTTGATIFLSPAAAADALLSADRRVCFLSHGWRSRVHPDPDGSTLRALLRFLRHPLGEHIVGVFVDFACLHQAPRSAEQEVAFKAALCVMPNGFASPLCTTVARCTAIPPCPAALAPVVAIVGVPESAGAAVRAALAGRDRTVKALGYDGAKRLWCGELGSAAQAEAALAALEKAMPAAPGVLTHASRWYNARPVDERGWCKLESAASEEMLARVSLVPAVAERLAWMPEKVVEISGAAPEAVAHTVEHGVVGAGSRIEGVRAALHDEAQTHFTEPGDRDVVLQMLSELASNVDGAMADGWDALSGVTGRYEGARNAVGQQEGVGTMRFASEHGEDVYTGEWVAGQMKGRGVYQAACGDVYDGRQRDSNSQSPDPARPTCSTGDYEFASRCR
jgi:hypothetical protein